MKPPVEDDLTKPNSSGLRGTGTPQEADDKQENLREDLERGE